MTSFRPFEPDQQLLLPPSLRDWLPPDHLGWFISETVDQLNLSEILDGYRDGGQGNLPYHPAMMLKILIHAYATGVFSSRRIARQIEENIAFRAESEGSCNKANVGATSIEARTRQVQEEEAHRRATLRVDEARAWLPTVQFARAREGDRRVPPGLPGDEPPPDGQSDPLGMRPPGRAWPRGRPEGPTTPRGTESAHYSKIDIARSPCRSLLRRGLLAQNPILIRLRHRLPARKPIHREE
jgi:transposase